MRVRNGTANGTIIEEYIYDEKDLVGRKYPDGILHWQRIRQRHRVEYKNSAEQ